MARFECTPPGRISLGFPFAWWAAADALLPEPDQLYLIAFFGKHCVRLGWMVRRPLGLVVTREPFTAIVDHRPRFGAGRNCDLVLSTELPVDSDLIRTIGSSSLPTRVMVPPVGDLIVARLPPILVTVPYVRLP